jgi:hypothetical protein
LTRECGARASLHGYRDLDARVFREPAANEIKEVYAMLRTLLRSLSLACLSLTAATGQAQVLKFNQPWTPRLPAFESRVFSCANPQPMARAAMDDWVCPQSGPIIRVAWWGTLFAPAQGQRPFFVAIYPDNGNCQPVLSQPLLRTCVRPDVVRVGPVDCQNRTVYYLSAPFPAGVAFTQVAGTRYWLQISEADAESIRPQLEDFRWSGHRAVNGCRAVQFGAPAVVPLPPDPCDDHTDDLAFRLYARQIIIHIPIGVRALPTVFLARMFDSSGVLADTVCVEPDGNGMAEVDTELPDGSYDLVLTGMGSPEIHRPVRLTTGQDTMVDISAMCFADTDGDGHVDVRDYLAFLANFSACP